MQFKNEKISEIWSEILPLLKENAIESGIKGIPFDPSKETYESLQNSGKLHAVSCRKNGELIGYSCFVITRHHQYPGSIFARQDAFYIKPGFRGITAIKLFKHIDKELSAMGVDFIIRQSTTEKDWSRTLSRSGYLPKETMFIKRVGQR